MTFEDFQRGFFNELAEAGIPVEECRALWARWTEWAGFGRIGYAMKDPKSLLPDAEMHQLLLHRLCLQEPWLHIIGTCEFAGLSLQVDARALIPRPETEEMLFLALEEAGPSGRALDWCCGSACLALGFQKHRPHWEVEAWDASMDALALAQENVQISALPVEVVLADLNQDPHGTPESWDLILANPPYIHPSEREHMDASVRDFEPAMALFSPKEDVLHYYKRLAQWAGFQLRANGTLWLECHGDHAQESAQIFKEKPLWKSVEIHKDFCGKERFIRAEKSDLAPIFER